MIISQRAEHEIYLPAFWAATKQAHASSVMCSYSTINGQYACENDYLLHQTLDQRWALPGLRDLGLRRDPLHRRLGGRR